MVYPSGLVKNTRMLNPRHALYPGSFDPISLGHLDIISRISKLYDRVTILVANSSQKQALFSSQERMELIRSAVKEFPNVLVKSSSHGLTVNQARAEGAGVIVRGLRAVVDFEYELSMSNMNRQLAPEIETVLVFASPEYYFLSSRAIKELVLSGGDPAPFVTDEVRKALFKKESEKVKERL